MRRHELHIFTCFHTTLKVWVCVRKSIHMRGGLCYWRFHKRGLLFHRKNPEFFVNIICLKTTTYVFVCACFRVGMRALTWTSCISTYSASASASASVSSQPITTFLRSTTEYPNAKLLHKSLNLKFKILSQSELMSSNIKKSLQVVEGN